MDPLAALANAPGLLQTARKSLPSPSEEPQQPALLAVKYDPQNPAARPGKNTFEAQRTSDKRGVGSYIARAIAEGKKTGMMLRKDKWDLLLQWCEEGTAEREKNGKGSVRLNFKDKYDQKDEHKWLKQRFKQFLEESPPNPASEVVGRLGEMAHLDVTSGADQDDDETSLDHKTSSKIKRKPSFQQAEESRMKKRPKRGPRRNYEESDDESTNDAESDEEDGDENAGFKQKAKIMESEVCSRGFSIIAGGTDSLDAKDVSLTDAPTCTLRIDIQAPRRRWIWINGEMQVFPPFFAEPSSNGGADGVNAGDVRQDGL